MHIKDETGGMRRGGRGESERGGGGGGRGRGGSCLRPVYDGHVEQQQISRLEMGADAHLRVGAGPGLGSRRKQGG
jgi:hypothetical protein